MHVELQSIGWTSKVSKKRETYSISINKLVARGASLEKGKVLYSYLGKDKNNRNMIITYLDGKEISKI